MANTIRIDRSGLEKAEAFLDKNVRLDGREKTTCLMICEELILRLLQSGNDALSVSVKRCFHPAC